MTTTLAAPQKIVQARNLNKIFKRDAFEIKSLIDVSLDIVEGEFLALMGPSGSGKTTLLNLIAGIDRPTAGKIIVGGQDITEFSRTRLARWRSEHVGYIFQLHNLVPVLTAFENIELPLLLLPLSAREREVMDHVILGRLNKQIAADLGASEATVKMHRSQAMKKMQAKSLPELVRMADKLKSIT